MVLRSLFVFSIGKQFLIFALTFLVISSISESKALALKLAFFKQYTPSGQLVRYEAGGDFAHIALSYRGQWLHAHPHGGVQLSASLDEIGMLDYTLIEKSEIAEPSKNFVKQALVKKFDVLSPWKDTTSTYCSKLVAQFLGIKPTPMSFQSQDWKNLGKNLPRGRLGISPDDIYKELIHQGFREFQSLSPQQVNAKDFSQNKLKCKQMLN